MKRMKPTNGVAIGFLVLAASAVSADTVTLLPRAEATGPYVRLVEVVAPDGLSPARSEAWRDVYLGHAPAPGVSRTIARESIRAELRKHGDAADALDWGGAAEVIVTAAPPGGTRDAAQGVLQEAVARGIHDLLLRDLPSDQPADDLRVRIVNLEWTAAAAPADGSYRVLRVEPRADGGSSRARRFMATFGPDDGASGETVACAAVAQVRYVQRGIRARRSLPAGSPIQPADVELGSTVVDELMRGVVATIEALAGCRARARIEKGTFLCDALIQAPVVVRPRDPVVVIVGDAEGRMSLTYSAEAMEAGAVGDAIRVRPVGSKRAGMARVAGPGAVRVEIPAVGHSKIQ